MQPNLISTDSETQRLRFRQWRAADFEPFARMNADPKVMEYFPKPLTRSESDALAQSLQDFIKEHGFGFWATELKETQEFIGFVGLSIPKAVLPFSPCIEVGWRLAAPYWGQGYALEAAKQALHIGFEKLGQNEIVSLTAWGNRRSHRVMKKLGMQDYGETFEHPNVPIGHPLRAHCLYRLSCEQWRLSDSYKNKDLK